MMSHQVLIHVNCPVLTVTDKKMSMQKQIQANAITCIREVPKAKDSFDGSFKYVNCSQ